MKKTILSILFLFMLIFTAGCSSKYLEKINLDDLNEKLNNKDSFVIYFYDTTSDLEVTLTNILEKNNLIGYKIDTSKITNDQKLTLQTKIDYKNPCIVFILEGKDPSVLSHITDEDVSEERITAALKDMNFIK